jgi:hypothetical protein
MEHQIDRGFEQWKLLPHRLPHPPLDAVAVHRLAHRLAYRKPNPRRVRADAAQLTVPSGPSVGRSAKK